jgi:hypothetical protein
LDRRPRQRTDQLAVVDDALQDRARAVQRRQRLGLVPQLAVGADLLAKTYLSLLSSAFIG